jgi:hypothetical protein
MAQVIECFPSKRKAEFKTQLYQEKYTYYIYIICGLWVALVGTCRF